MARWIEMSYETQAVFTDWLASSPPACRELIKTYDLKMDTLYQIKATGERVIIRAFCFDTESVALTLVVDILHMFNPELTKAQYFDDFDGMRISGVPANQLVECDLPMGTSIYKEPQPVLH